MYAKGQIFLAVLVLFLPADVFSDWEAIGPETCEIGGIVQSSSSTNVLYCMAEGDTDYRCMRSLDHGLTWEYMGDCACEFQMMYSFVIGPSDVLFVGSSNELFMSLDEGVSWDLIQLSGVSFCDISPHPSNDQIIQVSGIQYDSSMKMAYLSSTDGGYNWDVTPLHPESGMGYAIAVCESNPNIIYIGGYAADTARVFRSADGGVSFSEVSSPIWPVEDRVYSLAVCSSDPDIVISGNASGLYRSVDGGGTWSQVSLKTDIFSVAISIIDPQKTFCTHAEGACRSQDGGISWAECSDQLYGTWFSGVLLSRDQVDHVCIYSSAGLFQSMNFGNDWSFEGYSSSYGWVSDLEVRSNPLYYLYAIISGVTLFESRDMGESWNPMIYAEDPMATNVAPDPFNPDMLFITVYNSGEGGVYYTADNGESWVCADSGFFWSCDDIEADPSTPGRYWVVGRTTAGGEGAISWTTDYGATWTRNDPIAGESIGRLVAVDPEHPDTVYALFDGGVGPYLVRTFNAGASWSFFSASELSGNFYDLIASPEQPGILYAACNIGSNKVAKSTDGGVNWIGTSLNYTTFDLHLDPMNPQTVYAATNSHGVWITTDGGNTWGEMNWGLNPDTYIRTVSLIPYQHAFCGGMDDCCFRWQLPLGISQPVTQSVPWNSSHLVYPNPSTGTFTFRLELESEQYIQVDVFDLAGRRMIEPVTGSYGIGISEIQLLSSDEDDRIPSGIYSVVVQSMNGTRTSTRLVLLR